MKTGHNDSFSSVLQMQKMFASSSDLMTSSQVLQSVLGQTRYFSTTGSALGMSNILAAIGGSALTAGGASQTLEMLRNLSVTSAGAPRLESVLQATRVIKLDRIIGNPRSLQGLFPDPIAATTLLRNIGIVPSLASTYLVSQQHGLGSALAEWSAINRTMSDLPSWIRPVSPLQATQPSWEIAATLGIAGLGRAGLIQDLLATLHTVRMPTVGFEAAAQMLEAADEVDADLAERVLHLLSTHADPILVALARTKDRVSWQGMAAIVGILISLVACYQSVEQTRLSHASAEAPPPAVFGEISRQLTNLKQEVARSHEEQKPDPAARVVSQTAPLRATPDTKGKIIGRVYPDDHLHVDQTERGWAHVEVYEYSSENITKGWVSRKVLRRSDH
ncbi:MAG: SH3 domain-containing protein [Janthinobacterium lividum]